MRSPAWFERQQMIRREGVQVTRGWTSCVDAPCDAGGNSSTIGHAPQSLAREALDRMRSGLSPTGIIISATDNIEMPRGFISSGALSVTMRSGSCSWTQKFLAQVKPAARNRTHRGFGRRGRGGNLARSEGCDMTNESDRSLDLVKAGAQLDRCVYDQRL